MSDKPYIVFRSPQGVGYVYFRGVVESETPKRIVLSRGMARHVRPGDVAARFATEKEADELVQRIHGAQGERKRRQQAAADACAATIDRLIKEATK